MTLAVRLQQRTAGERAGDLSRGHSREEDAPAATGAPAAGEPSTDPPAPSAGLWQRFRAALLGH